MQQALYRAIRLFSVQEMYIEFSFNPLVRNSADFFSPRTSCKKYVYSIDFTLKQMVFCLMFECRELTNNE